VTAATLGGAAGADAPEGGATLTDAVRREPAERGSLTIADRVVEKVAAQAVRSVPHASGAPRRVLGLNIGDTSDDSIARVDADVDAGVADLAVNLTVEWPTPVRQVVDAVRRAVRDDVRRITGVTVQQIDIDVVSLTKPQRPEPRVE
jgi:uncharacterized alkaline shock family protein YloU